MMDLDEEYREINRQLIAAETEEASLRELNRQTKEILDNTEGLLRTIANVNDQVSNGAYHSRYAQELSAIGRNWVGYRNRILGGISTQVQNCERDLKSNKREQDKLYQLKKQVIHRMEEE